MNSTCGRVRSGPDLALEVFDVRAIHLGGDAQPLAGPAGDLDRPVDPLLRRDAPEKREVAPVSRALSNELRRKPMVDGTHPRRLQERLLRIRDRYDGHVAELTVHGREVRQIQAPVERRDVRDSGPAGERKVQVVDVEVNDVELGRPLKDFLEEQHVVRQRVHAGAIEAQGPRRARHQTRGGHGVSAGEERDVVALRHELLGQV